MIIINRNNYEEFFLLYTDDELNAAEKHAVEEFVRQNPDLKIELEMLQQSVLHAEPIVFHDKDSLLKNSSSMINEINCEEYFVLYTDDELNDEQKDSVEQFVYRHPQFRAEFELIQKAKLQADSHIVFADKASLYRTEEDEKVVVFRWWRIAVAAIIFLFLSGLGWYFVSKDKPAELAGKNIPKEKIEQPMPEKQSREEENITKSNPVVSEPKILENPSGVVRQRDSNQPASDKKKENPEMLMATQKEEKINEGRNIQIASTVVQEKPEVDINKMEGSESVSLQNQKKIIDEAVGTVEENPYAYTASNDQIEILNTTVSKKNKLRGLFRKVSRVVEKTTNIETGDGRGIRIANFEIALK